MKSKFKDEVVNNYLSCIASDNNHRYSSWNYCYEAFSVNDSTNILPLHLGFYLASWGMYRGSGGLLQKNHRIHEGAVEILFSKQFQALKCDSSRDVNENSIELILQLKNELAKHYKSIRYSRGTHTQPISDTDTLLSKILLGTMACVPAFDRYFVDGLKQMGMKYWKFDKYSLMELFDFIEDNRTQINQFQNHIKNKTRLHYPVMKIMDMYFWQIGFDYELNKNIKL